MCSGLGSFNPVPFFTRGKFIDRAVPTMPNPIRQLQGKVDSSGRPIERPAAPPPASGMGAADLAELRRRQAVVEAAARRLRQRRGVSFLTRQPGLLDQTAVIDRQSLLSP